MLRITDVDI